MTPDSEELLTKDLQSFMRDFMERCIALGEKRAYKSIFAKVSGELGVPPPIPPSKQGGIRRRISIPPKATEYGAVKQAVKDILDRAPEGLTRGQISEVARAEGSPIKEGSVKSAVKQLIKQGIAVSHGGLIVLK